MGEKNGKWVASSHSPQLFQLCLKRLLLSHGWPIVYVQSKKPFVWLSANTEMDSYSSHVNRPEWVAQPPPTQKLTLTINKIVEWFH